MNKPPRILVVEDDAEIAKLYRLLLESRGYAVELAATVKDGLEGLERFCPRLVILDLQVRDEDGLEILRGLRRERESERVPVLVVTAEDGARVREECVAGGADGFLLKPFENRRFLDLVAGLAGGPAAFG